MDVEVKKQGLESSSDDLNIKSEFRGYLTEKRLEKCDWLTLEDYMQISF